MRLIVTLAQSGCFVSLLAALTPSQSAQHQVSKTPNIQQFWLSHNYGRFCCTSRDHIHRCQFVVRQRLDTVRRRLWMIKTHYEADNVDYGWQRHMLWSSHIKTGISAHNGTLNLEVITLLSHDSSTSTLIHPILCYQLPSACQAPSTSMPERHYSFYEIKTVLTLLVLNNFFTSCQVLNIFLYLTIWLSFCLGDFCQRPLHVTALTL